MKGIITMPYTFREWIYEIKWKNAEKDRTITKIEDVGIIPPFVYKTFKHANCTGCLKAGLQHWYIVYCTRKDIWEKAKWAENEIGHSIMKEDYLEDFEERFEEMKNAGVPANEKIPFQEFWAKSRRMISRKRQMEGAFCLFPIADKPCECMD